MSSRKLPALALTLALLAACASPVTPTGAISGSVLTSSQQSAANAKVSVYDQHNNLLASGTTNALGQFLISNVPVGDVTVIVSTAQNSEQARVNVLAGRVASVPPMQLIKAASSTTATAITGRVVDKNNNPVANATVTDMTGGQPSVQTVTNASGEFSLTVARMDKPRTLEVAKDNMVTSTTVTTDKVTGLSVTLIPNVRTISGTITDAVFSDRRVADVTVKVAGTTISTATDVNGNFLLRGVPFDRVTVEASGKEGYGIATVAQEPGQDNLTGVNFELTPYGNLVVQFAAESSPYGQGLSLQQQHQLFAPFWRHFDVNGDQRGGNRNGSYPDYQDGEFFYDNGLAILNDIPGTVSVEGTSQSQDFIYLKAKEDAVLSQAGQELGKVRWANWTQQVVFKGVPGGTRSVSVSLLGHEIQKGISVIVPPLDTVSTDLIVLRRLQSNVTVGDVDGRILGVDSADMSNVRVGFVPQGYSVDMTLGSPDPNRPMVLTVKQVLDAGSTPNSDGIYRLFRVPTGSRVVVAGVVDGRGGYDGPYVPNTVSLLNVVEGVINQAPDLRLHKR